MGRWATFNAWRCMRHLPTQDHFKVLEMVPNGKYVVFGANGIIGRYDKYNPRRSSIIDYMSWGYLWLSNYISEPKSWITGNAMVVRPTTDELGHTFS